MDGQGDMTAPTPLNISPILETRDGLSIDKDSRFTNMLIEIKKKELHFLKRQGYAIFDGGTWSSGPGLGATTLPDNTVLTIVATGTGTGTGTGTSTWTGTGTGVWQTGTINISPYLQSSFTTGSPIQWKIISAISPSIVVTAKNFAGQTLTGYTGTITISLFANPNGATLSGTLSVAATAGVATFSNLMLDKIGNGYKFAATGTNIRTAIGSAFNIVSTLAFTTQPGGGPKNTAFTAVVSCVDSAGGVITGYTKNVTIAISANPGSPPGVLTGTLTQTAVSGVATFNDLQIDQNGNGYTLIASEA